MLNSQTFLIFVIKYFLKKLTNYNLLKLHASFNFAKLIRQDIILTVSKFYEAQ